MKKSLLILSFCLFISPLSFAQLVGEYDPQNRYLIMGRDTLRNVSALGNELTIGDNHTFKSPDLNLEIPIQGGYNIVSVERRAFMNCQSIKLIRLPSTIRLLEAEAFASCKNASIIVMESTKPPQCDTSVFSSTPIDLCIVPKYYQKVYQNPMVFYPSKRRWAYVENNHRSVNKIMEEKLGYDADEDVKLDKLPSFPGGLEEMFSFIRENLTYPERAQNMEIQGTIYVSFVVDKSGNLCDIMVVKSVSKELDNECLRIMKLMPKWEPGMLDDKPVNVYFIIPFTFKLD